jgi:hypothetical protein
MIIGEKVKEFLLVVCTKLKLRAWTFRANQLVRASCIGWLNFGQSLIDFDQAKCYFCTSKMLKIFET